MKKLMRQIMFGILTGFSQTFDMCFFFRVRVRERGKVFVINALCLMHFSL